jgi:hypothetical protein
MPNDKSPGLDGFDGLFMKKNACTSSRNNFTSYALISMMAE